MPDLSDPTVVQFYLQTGFDLATQALLAIAILAAGWMVAKWGQRLAVRSAAKLDKAVAGFFGNLVRYALLAASVIAALEAVGVQTTSLVAILGAAGLAVGLALQGSLSNFASGVMILIFRPFQLGELVNAGGEEGFIDEIGLFATTLTTLERHTIIVPNSAITGGTITNFTRAGLRRGSVDIGVAYGTDLKAVQAAAMAAVGRAEHALKDPAPGFAFVEMAASSINFKVHVFAKPEHYLDMLHEVRSNVYDELGARGLEIPFDQLVLHKAEDAA